MAHIPEDWYAQLCAKLGYLPRHGLPRSAPVVRTRRDSLRVAPVLRLVADAEPVTIRRYVPQAKRGLYLAVDNTIRSTIRRRPDPRRVRTTETGPEAA